METLGEPLFYFLPYLFKSYYVVWKRKKEFIHEYFIKGLNRTMQYGNYLKFSISQPKTDSLNRTMQYGNDQQHTDF